MFPSEEEAQQALQDAPTTYGQHVLRGNWGIQSAQDWLASGKEITPDELISFFNRLARKKEAFISFIKRYREFVVKDKNIKSVNKQKFDKIVVGYIGPIKGPLSFVQKNSLKEKPYIKVNKNRSLI